MRKSILFFLVATFFAMTLASITEESEAEFKKYIIGYLQSLDRFDIDELKEQNIGWLINLALSVLDEEGEGEDLTHAGLLRDHISYFEDKLKQLKNDVPVPKP